MKMNTFFNNKNYKIFFIILLYLLIPIMFYFYGKIVNFDILPTTAADFIQYFSQMKSFGSSILNKEFPQWNLYLAAGVPQIIISGMYLPNIFLSLLPLKLFMYAFFWLHMFIGGLGFYLYSKEKGLKTDIAVLIGIIFEISIQINGLRRGHCGLIAAISLFPIIMFFTKKYANTNNLKWLCTVAVISALQTSAWIQHGFYAQIIIFVYLTYTVYNQKYSFIKTVKLIVIYLAFYIGAFSIYLFPILSVLREYSSFGSSSTDFITFSSWSMHPIKTIMLVYPFIFKDIYQAFGNMNSSEMDIEIFFGTTIFLLFIVSVFIHKEIKTSKIEIICLCIALCLTCIAHIPVINKIAFQIPVLNGFRCSGRALYLFNFFYLSLASETIQVVVNSDLSTFNTHINLVKKIALIFFAVTVVICISAVSFILGYSDTSLNDSLKNARHVFIRSILVSFAFYMVITILKRDFKFSPIKTIVKLKRYAFLSFILFFTAIEILPFSLTKYFFQFSEVLPNNFDTILKNDTSYKTWDAFCGVNGGHDSIISQNKNINKSIQAINAYIAFNNPNISKYFKNLSSDITKIPFNFSGLQTGSFSASQILTSNNDMLSMLGIKYLLDSSKLIQTSNGVVYKIPEYMTKSVLLEEENLIVSEYFENIGCMTIIDHDIKSDFVYEVEFDIDEADSSALNFLAVDLFGGENYDSATQEVHFPVGKQGKQHCKAHLYSMDTTRANFSPIMRVMTNAIGNRPIQLKNLQVKAFPIEKQHAYEYFANDSSGVAVYINKDARTLIYSPSRISSITNWDDLYLSKGEYELDKIAYLLNENKKYDVSESKITDLKLLNNSVSATVSADEDTYICFSQCYSKYWKVKIDGKKQKVDFVNGVIMGTSIPKGNHSVLFYYSNPFYPLGIIISLLTIVSLVLVFRKEKNTDAL